MPPEPAGWKPALRAVVLDRWSHFEVFARQVVAVQSDGARLRTSRLARTRLPSENCGGWTLVQAKMQIETTGRVDGLQSAWLSL